MSKTATSKPTIVNGVTYNTTVTKRDDGSLSTVQKSGDRVVRTLETKQNADGTWSTTSNIVNATPQEQVALQDPNSPLRTASSAMAKDAQSQIEGSTTNAAQKPAYNQAGGGSGNQAPNAANPDSQGGDSEKNPPTTLENLQNAVQDSVDIRKQYPIVNYPIDRDPKQDYIMFTMVRYSPKSFSFSSSGGTNGLGGFGDRVGKGKNGSREILGHVTLPIQPNITDTNMVAWGESRLNAFEAASARGSLNIMTEGAKGVNKSIDEVVGAAAQNSAAIKAVIASKLAESAVGNQGGELFTRLTGGIVNPNLELLFQGPSLRSFTFTFTLSAREEKEAQAIRQIIRFFKQGMSAKRATTSLFLMSPNTFNIQYIYGETNKDHPWINKIKECALQGFSVDYTPAGNYATYSGGAMTEYNLSLTFGELDPIYDDDYKKLDENSSDPGKTVIGY